MDNKRHAAALHIGRDLCLKLIEQRSLAPEQTAEAITILTLAAKNLFQEIKDGQGLWVLRLARDFTAKMIERNQLSGVQAAAASLAENARFILKASASIPAEDCLDALGAARDLALKFMETGRVSVATAPDCFIELALAAAAAIKAGKD